MERVVAIGNGHIRWSINARINSVCSDLNVNLEEPPCEINLSFYESGEDVDIDK